MRWKKWEETRGELITERSLPLAISGMNEFMLIMGLDRQRNALLISPRGLKHWLWFQTHSYLSSGFFGLFLRPFPLVFLSIRFSFTC